MSGELRQSNRTLFVRLEARPVGANSAPGRSLPGQDPGICAHGAPVATWGHHQALTGLEDLS